MIESSNATDRDRSIIAGHYVFSLPECEQIKIEAKTELRKKGIDLDNELKNSVKAAISRYLLNFRLVNLS